MDMQIGQQVVLRQPYNGYWYGVVVETLGPERFGLCLSSGQCSTGEWYKGGTVVDFVTRDVWMCLDAPQDVANDVAWMIREAHRGPMAVL